MTPHICRHLDNNAFGFVVPSQLGALPLVELYVSVDF
jgi:hypothetical protein